MSILEVIHLRMAGNDPTALAETVGTVVGDAVDLRDLRIYRHARVEGDLLVHLHREATDPRDQASELGLRLAALLRAHGLVEHSVWVRCGGSKEPV